jgi:hypothetical protein
LQRQQKALLTAVAVGALGLVSLAKTSKLGGKIVGYDVMRHVTKTTSGVQNQEVVVLETDGPKQKYSKIVFSSFGTTQIEQKYFDGTEPLTVDVLRDHSCDEKEPRFVSQVSLDRIAGTYLLTDAFKTQPPAKIKTLECYAAIFKKK